MLNFPIFPSPGGISPTGSGNSDGGGRALLMMGPASVQGHHLFPFICFPSSVLSRILWLSSLLLYSHFCIFSHWYLYCVLLICTYDCPHPWHSSRPHWGMWAGFSEVPHVCPLGYLGMLTSQQSQRPTPLYLEAPKTDWWITSTPPPQVGTGPKEQGQQTF